MRGSEKHSAVDRLRRAEGRSLQYAAYGFFLLFCFILQMTPGALPRIAGGRPLLLIPGVVCVGMFTDPVTGGICGAIAGFAWDMFSARPTGLCALFLLAAGCISGLLVQLLMRNNWLTALLLCGAATFLQGILDWLLTCVLWRLPDSGQVLLGQFLPNFVYTAAAILPLYYLTLAIAKRLKLSR